MVKVHSTADVSPASELGNGTSVWHGAQVRERARLGHNCIVGKNAYIDFEVVIGSNVKIQNNASLYHGLEIEDGVFVGPHVILPMIACRARLTPMARLKAQAIGLSGEHSYAVGPRLAPAPLLSPG